MPSRRATRRWTRAGIALFLVLVATTTLRVLGAGAAPEKDAGGIRFTYSDANAASVSWVGEFNGWNNSANPMAKTAAGTWSIVLPLPPGQHQYKFYVDSQWVPDPENPATIGDAGNSVVNLGPDGELIALKPTSNTLYSSKILLGGRVIGLYQSIYNPSNTRYELTRPNFDIDLDFDVRASDVLKAHLLLNVNPGQEDVQDFRSRLNFKRGSLLLTQPSFSVLAFDSENIGTWSDALHLVGDIGVFGHPYGYKRQGVKFDVRRYGFDAEALYTDNFDDRMRVFTDIDNFPTFAIGPSSDPRFNFEGDPVGKALALLQTTRTTDGFALILNQATKLLTLDFGDNDKLFGVGDNNENAFATRIHRNLSAHWGAGLLARADRGFGLGRMVLAEPRSDSTVRLLSTLYSQQWYGGGVESSWEPSPHARVFGEVLLGTRRMNFVNGSTASDFQVTTINAGGVRVSRSTDSITVTPADGDHRTLDKGLRLRIGGSWTLAQGDVTVRGDVERDAHRVPAWTQSPITPAGLVPVDHARFETVEFQRAQYALANQKLDNTATTARIGWDRNWRYYLNREVKSSIDLEWTHFDYDSRTAWEHQLWFPTGNFWLENGQHLVSIDRLTLLGEEHAIRLRPVVEIPIRKQRDVRFTYRGTLAGVDFDKNPRYAESIFQLGFDLTRSLRFSSDTRWAKYDAPALGLGSGYLSEFAKIEYRFAPTMRVSFGFGVDPDVLDPNTNEYATIGRDVFLNERNANGFIAETNYLSLAPQIAAAERALQNQKRFQIQAVVRF